MNSYLKQALIEAKEGIQKQEGGPFGAVIVYNNKIIAAAHNEVLVNHDPTAHAEINAIRKASAILKTHDLKDCVIYSTCEPCPMCLAAIIWANIKTVYYGCSKKDASLIGFRDEDIYEYLKGHKKMVDLKQIDYEECLKVMQEYQNKQGKIY